MPPPLLPPPLCRQVEALRRETDRASVERRKALEAEIEAKEKEMATLTVKWNAEKDALSEVKGAKERLESARRDLSLAEARASTIVCFFVLLLFIASQHTLRHTLTAAVVRSRRPLLRRCLGLTNPATLLLQYT